MSQIANVLGGLELQTSIPGVKDTSWFLHISQTGGIQVYVPASQASELLVDK